MSQKNLHEESLANILFALLRGLLVVPIVATVWLQRALFLLFRQPLSRRLRLETHCLRWPLLKWVLLPLQWIAVMGFGGCIVATALLFWHQPVSAARLALAFLYLGLAILCSFAFNVVAWMKEDFAAPATQQKLAGLKAERHVRQRIAAYQQDYPETIALHGALLVFHEGMKEEFSIEADHVLITPRNVFVIETKYKSGTIHAAAAAKDWAVTTVQGTSRMRNALNQAKNTARVIGRQMNIPVAPVPIVAIHGNGVQLVDAPANVVTADGLAFVIEAFEASQTERRLGPTAVAEQLLRYCSEDETVMQRHLVRAEQARRRAEMAAIVDAASLP